MSFSADVSATFTADGADAFAVDAAFEVEDGETLVILGPSGSGKTLLLETVAGFHDHEGVVSLDSERLDAAPPEQRDFGFVFQDYALFPHMTVRENVAFGDPYRADSRDAESILAELGVGHLADRYPPTLSGGEQQRVALARALAVRPSVLLLDEPLSSLDVPTRQSLRDDLQDLLADQTAVHVTHDRTTARALADRIVVMNDGQVVQSGTPTAVFDRPASPLVARFTGSNALPLEAVPDLRTALAVDPTEGATHLAVRPEHVRLDGDSGTVSGRVERVTREDATSRVTVALDGADVEVDAYVDDPPAPGTVVGLSVSRDRVALC